MSAYIVSYLNTALGQEPARNFTIYAPCNFSIITGYYTSNNTLIDVSLNAVITIIDQPASNSIQVNGALSNNFYLLQPGPYTFQIVYTDTNLTPHIAYTYYLSFTAMSPLRLPEQNDIYNIIKRSEPQGVYTQVQTFLDAVGNNVVGGDYTDVTSVASVFNSLYNDIQSVYDNILPSGGNTNWEQTLNGTSGLISNQEYSNIVLQMLYSLLIKNSGNKYDVSLFLSKYIWYRSNGTIQAYVHIEEVTIINYLFWILGISLLGVNTFLSNSIFTPYIVGVYIIPQNGAVITPAFQIELNNLVNRILPYGFTYQVFYNETLEELGLVQQIQQAFKTDTLLTGSTSLLNEFALLYIPTNVEQATAYLNPFAPQNLVSLTMNPPSGTNFTANTIDSYVITGTYLNGFTKDLTTVTTTYSTDVTILQIASRGSLYAVANGAANIVFQYGFITGFNSYTVTSLGQWVLDASALNSTTILTGTTTGNWVLNYSALDNNATLT